MSNAWETTNEDVLNVLNRHDVKVSQDRLEEIGDMLNADAIVTAALCGDEMEEQTAFAYDEIESQLREAGILPRA